MKLPLTLFLSASLSCFAAEPAIYSLTLKEQFTLNSDTNMGDRMVPNAEITTKPGAQIFSSSVKGFTVNKSGLYRVSYFQRVVGRASHNVCVLYLVQNFSENIKRYKIATADSQSEDEISFTQILRLSAGDTLQLLIRPFTGQIEFEVGLDSSAFVIEEIIGAAQ